MHFWLAALIVFALIAAVGLLSQAIRKRMARRTISAWAGEGVNRDLLPPDAALLLGHHPSVLVFLLFHLHEMAGRARLLSLDPVRVEWVGGSPSDPVEAAFVEALDDDGRFVEKRVFDLLEALYDWVNEAMVPFSGRLTAIYYRQLVGDLSREAFSSRTFSPEVNAWLLLRDPRLLWGRLGDSEDEASLKSHFRAKVKFEERLVPMGSYLEMKEGAVDGFFAYPRDLVRRSPDTPELDRFRWSKARW
jgi:hypothetical protein